MEKESSLEAALQRLEKIVSALEKNDFPLEESLKLFEEGVSLTRACNEHLQKVEQKVEILTRVGKDGAETKKYLDEE